MSPNSGTIPITVHANNEQIDSPDDILKLEEPEDQPEPESKANYDEYFNLIKEAHSEKLQMKNHSLSMTFNETKKGSAGATIEQNVFCSGEQF